jgi:hypothetical protein
MVSGIIFCIWVLGLVLVVVSEHGFVLLGWLLLSLAWIIPIFTGVNVPNGGGQYIGYVVAVEQSGAIFKGYKLYIKTDLASSNEDQACINRDDSVLIERLKTAQANKENVVLEYESVWQYPIGECPGGWKVVSVK